MSWQKTPCAQQRGCYSQDASCKIQRTAPANLPWSGAEVTPLHVPRTACTNVHWDFQSDTVFRFVLFFSHQVPSGQLLKISSILIFRCFLTEAFTTCLFSLLPASFPQTSYSMLLRLPLAPWLSILLQQWSLLVLPQNLQQQNISSPRT